MKWHVEIVESNQIIQGCSLDLSGVLDRLSAGGWAIKTVLPNGVNRWTVIAFMEQS